MTAPRVTMPSIPVTSAAFAYRDSRSTDVASTIAQALRQQAMLAVAQDDSPPAFESQPRRRVRAGAPAMPQFPQGGATCVRS